MIKLTDNNEILDTLRRIEEWLAILAKAQLAPIAKAELSDPKMAQLYKLTGSASQAEIQTKLKMSPNTVSDMWKRWEQIGLLVRDGKRYRRVL